MLVSILEAHEMPQDTKQKTLWAEKIVQGLGNISCMYLTLVLSLATHVLPPVLPGVTLVVPYTALFCSTISLGLYIDLLVQLAENHQE